MAACSKCGQDLKEGAAFCTACGTPVEAVPEQPTEISPPSGESSDMRCGPFTDPDRYALQEVRSRGGEGQVWRGTLAIDTITIQVAVKVINESNADQIDDWSKRWQQQAEILKTLNHPGLVKVRDTFEGPLPHPAGAADPASRSLFLVMNWVEGASLVEWVARNPERDLLESVRVIARVAAAVDYLHSGASTGTPLLHRDIKPANVLIDGTSVCLVDFGFARLMSGEMMTLAGTPYYLAPEIVGGGAASEASDRYSLGATAYYTIVGEPPTPGDITGMRARLTAVRGAEGRNDLADHVLAMLDPDPAKRPLSTVEWAQSLAAGAVSVTLPTPVMPPAAAATTAVATGAAAAAGPKKSRKKMILIGAIVALVAIGGAAIAYAATRGSDEPKPVAVVSPSPSWSPSPLTSEQDTSANALNGESPSPAAGPSDGEPGATAVVGRTVMNISEYLSPVSGEIQTGKTTMKTKDYQFSLYAEQDVEWGDELSVEYNVPKGFDTFIATIGMDDASPSAAKTTFQVTNAITGRYLFGSRGKPVVIKMNQVRRVEIKLPANTLRIKLTAFCDDGGSGSYVYPVWGDARFTGPSDKATLPKSSN